jgi:hypothetical protein
MAALMSIADLAFGQPNHRSTGHELICRNAGAVRPERDASAAQGKEIKIREE